ncbi:MAG: hypothetical protein ABF806_01795 [Bifidobacterium psychraerophilum]|uniref:hypothetical protein n=1 Tax=Bifidobacterium psychraerophilum TaxID=218140 RepID=UPI0039E7518A
MGNVRFGMQANWVEYRRDSDGERLGWIIDEEQSYTAVDLLGERRFTTNDWLKAEQYLNNLGLAYLSERYELRTKSGEWVPVRIVGLSPNEILVKIEDFGALEMPMTTYHLPFPKPQQLRLR